MPPSSFASAAHDAYASESGFDWNSIVEWNDERGVLAGRVLRGIAPLEDARIALWRNDAQAWPPLVDAQPLFTAASDRDGRFRFDKLIAGNYRLRAEHNGEFIEQPSAPFDDQAQNRVVHLMFGSSVIDGHVFDDQGLARTGQRVRVAGIGPAPSRAVWADTDAAGFFRCTGLLAGRYHVQIEQGEKWEANRERMIELGVADRVSVRFGRVLNAARWTGRLVDALGEVVPSGRLLVARNAATKDSLRFWSAADGSFALDLGDGEWTVFAEANSGTKWQLGSASLDGRDTERDLLLPGVRLVIEIAAERQEDLAINFHEQARESLRLLSGVGESALPPERVGEMHVQWCLLEPRNYELISMSLPRIADSELLGPEVVRTTPGESPRSLRIEVRADEPVRRMQLRMTGAPWGER